MQHPASTPATSGRTPADRRRMVLAILAGGLVLGVGAAVTLAVWNDSEFATGTFSSGQFDLEGSTDGAAFSSSPAAPGKTLDFELDADLLTPTDAVYAPFAVQLSGDSDYSASVTLANTAGGGDIGANLTWSLYDVGTFGATCSEATPPTGTPIIANSAATAPAVPVFTLDAAADPTNLCFVVTAGAVPQGATGTITWEFVGTSVDPLP